MRNEQEAALRWKDITGGVCVVYRVSDQSCSLADLKAMFSHNRNSTTIELGILVVRIDVILHRVKVLIIEISNIKCFGSAYLSSCVKHFKIVKNSKSRIKL